MPVTEASIQLMGRALTATAELALHLREPNAWATGDYAIRLRDHMDVLFELLEDANDAIEKPRST